MQNSLCHHIIILFCSRASNRTLLRALEGKAKWGAAKVECCMPLQQLFWGAGLEVLKNEIYQCIQMGHPVHEYDQFLSVYNTLEITPSNHRWGHAILLGVLDTETKRKDSMGMC